MMNKRKAFFWTGGAIFLAIAAVFAMGYYPAAIVNGQIIGVSRLNRGIDLAVRFYAAQMKLEGSDAVILQAQETEREIKRAVLESLIVDSLVEGELQRRIGTKDLEEMLENRLAAANLDSEDFKKGSELLYGLSVEELKNFILTPRAKLEILEGNLKVHDKDFELWLEKARKEAKVSVFIPDFVWQDGAIKTSFR